MEYSISEVADIIQMSRESVRRYIKIGLLEGVKDGKSYKISKPALVRFLMSDNRELTKERKSRETADAEH